MLQLEHNLPPIQSQEISLQCVERYYVDFADRQTPFLVNRRQDHEQLSQSHFFEQGICRTLTI